jgi:hypothetical protein
MLDLGHGDRLGVDDIAQRRGEALPAQDIRTRLVHIKSKYYYMVSKAMQFNAVQGGAVLYGAE